MTSRGLAGAVCLALAGQGAGGAGMALAQTIDDQGPLILGPIEESPLTLGPIEENPLTLGPPEEDPLTLGPPEESTTTEEITIEAENGTGATIRALDKMSGRHEDLTLTPGETGRFGRLQVMLGECRYPSENPEGDAYAYLVIRSEGHDEPVFSGWMVASSPALNALDHQRYDVWVIRCTTS